MIEDRLVAVPGGSMFVRSWHHEDARDLAPVVLLHDSLGCVELWRDIPATLSSRLGRSIIAYDRLGFGRSSAREELPSQDFMAEEAAVYFPHIWKALDLKNFILFGYSVGGGMAFEIAARNRDCLAVVSESAQIFVEPRTIEGVQLAKERFSGVEQLRRLQKYHGEKAAWVLRAWTEVWLTPERATWTLRDTLKKIHCPVLAIHGDHDDFGSRRFPETIRELVGASCRMEIFIDCGHMPHREHEQQFIEILTDFLMPLP